MISIYLAGMAVSLGMVYVLYDEREDTWWCIVYLLLLSWVFVGIALGFLVKKGEDDET